MSFPKHKPNAALKLDFVSHLINNYHNVLLSEYGITTKQAKVLSYLVHHQGEDILQKDIEDVFFLRSSTVTSVMQNLEKAGFIERYTNKTDKRMKRILVTAKGYEAFEHCQRIVEELDLFVSSNWTKEEKEEFFRLLETIVEKLKYTR